MKRKTFGMCAVSVALLFVTVLSCFEIAGQTKNNGLKPLDTFEKVEKATTFMEGDIIDLDELSFEILHTPGHTSGSVCIILKDNMFTGDTLFKDSRGRTDLVDASHTDMAMSLRKLRVFKGRYDNYNIYAGHGANTTLNVERENNVYLRGFDYDDMF